MLGLRAPLAAVVFAALLAPDFLRAGALAGAGWSAGTQVPSRAGFVPRGAVCPPGSGPGRRPERRVPTGRPGLTGARIGDGCRLSDERSFPIVTAPLGDSTVQRWTW